MTDGADSAAMRRPSTALPAEFLSLFHPGGPWHLVAIALGGRTEAQTFDRSDVASMRHWIDQRQGKANLYFSVNQLRPEVRNAKAKKTDVVAAVALHVDIDSNDQKTLEALDRFSPKATVVVSSGGGYQPFWLLDQPCADLERVERCNLALAHALGGDNCHNADRIMRLPGTLNIPNAKKRAAGRTTTLASVVDELTDWTRRYPIDQFSEAEDTPSAGVVVIPTGEVSLVDVDALPIQVNEVTRNLIIIGDDTDAPIGSEGARYPSRSEALFRVVCDLVRANCSPMTVAGIILNPVHGISASVLDKPDPKAYAFRQIQAAKDAVSEAWPDVSRHGIPRSTLRNTMVAIRRLGLHCEYDEFKHRKIMGGRVLQSFAGDLSDDGCAVLRRVVIEEFGFDPGKENSREAANVLCLENTYHPIRDYLGALDWDGVPRVDTWLRTHLGADDTPLNRAIGRKMLVAAVRRVRQPGSKFDQIIVLEGPPGHRQIDRTRNTRRWPGQLLRRRDFGTRPKGPNGGARRGLDSRDLRT